MKHILFLKITLILALFNFANAQTCSDYITNDWQDSRYTDHGNGTITDTATGLMWKKCSEGLSGSDCSTGSATTYTWQDALALNGSSFAGKSDWRLPNIKELSSLAALNCYNPSINKTMFPNTPATSFWSSSPSAYISSYAWRLYFNNGINFYNNNRDFSNRVRLVRNSP
jgi:hypothetical protein